MATTVCAAAGYGKTTMLSDFYDRFSATDTICAWLTLDDTDGDPNILIHSIVAACATAGVEIGSLGEVVTTSLGAQMRALQSALMLRLHEAGRPIILVIDDYHVSQNQKTEALLSGILQQAPENFRLIISSREKPNIEQEKLRSFGQLLELGPADLSFSLVEIKAYFEGELSEAEAAELLRATEGWPIAVQLVKLHQKQSDEPKLLDTLRFIRSDQLGSYLLEQVFLKLEPEVQNFLLETAQFESVDCDVVNEICERSDCWQMFEHLISTNLFVTAYRPGPPHFRYHNLFAEFLKQRLHRVDNGAARRIHKKASRWFAENGQVQEALFHALEGEDYEGAAELVEGAGGWLNTFYNNRRARKLLAIDREEILERFPQLYLGYIFLRLQSAEIAEALLAFETLVEKLAIDVEAPLTEGKGADNDLAVDCHMLWLLFGIYQDRSLTRNDLNIQAAFLKRAKALSPLAHAMLINLLAFNHFKVGKLSEARLLAEEASQRFSKLNRPMKVYTELYLCLISHAQGKFPETFVLLRRVEKSAQENFGPYSSVEIICSLLRAKIYYEENRIDQAVALFDEYLPLLDPYEISFDLYVPFYITASRLGISVTDQNIIPAAGVDQNVLQKFVQAEQLLKARQVSQAGLLIEQLSEAFGLDLIVEDIAWRWQTRHYIMLLLVRYHLLAGNTEEAQIAVRKLSSSIARHDHHRLDTRVGFLAGVLALIDEDMAGGIAKLEDVLERSQMLGNFRSIRDEIDFLPDFVSHYQRYRSHFSAGVRQYLAEILDDDDSLQSGAPDQDPSAISLTPRERQVILSMNDGLANKEIAAILDISENTVKGYRKNVYEKLEVNSRSQAIAKARALGLI